MENMTLEEKVIYLYRGKKLSARQVAEKLNISKSTVTYYARKNGIVRDHKTACKLRSNDEYVQRVANAKIGNKNPAAKLDEKKVLAIREEYQLMLKNKSIFKTKKELGEHYGVKRQTINDVVFNRTWTHI